MSFLWWLIKPTQSIQTEKKRGEKHLYTTSFMNLRCIMLSERSETLKVRYCMLPSVWHSRKDQTVMSEKKFSGYQGLGIWDVDVHTVSMKEFFLGHRTVMYLVIMVTWLLAFKKCTELLGLPGGASGKESTFQCRRCKRCSFYPGVGNSTPPQYSCLENSWAKEPGRLQSMRSQAVRHNWETEHSDTNSKLTVH